MGEIRLWLHMMLVKLQIATGRTKPVHSNVLGANDM